MDTALIISICSAIIALAALPFSYFVAINQVKAGLRENEKNSQATARHIAANALEEFMKVFLTSAVQKSGLTNAEIKTDGAKLNPYLKEIDEFVFSTGIVGRLASAIDTLAMSKYGGLDIQSAHVSELQSIRANLSRESSPEYYPTVAVATILGSRGDRLIAALRNAPEG